MYNIKDFYLITPMKYYNNEDAANPKRIAMIENEGNNFIATEKRDGDWGMFIHESQGINHIRSRSISKVTGTYGDYTAKLPHLTREMDNWPDNTVVLAEICWPIYGTNANTVGTILRCLPAKAVERQKTQPLFGIMFDLLMLNGRDLTTLPYEERLSELFDLIGNYFQRTTIFKESFAEHADAIISAGGEGIVIQRKDNPYLPGTRTAWKTLKLKQSLPEMELLVVKTLPPKRNYEGQDASIWPYWEGTYIDTGEKVKIDHTPGNVDNEGPWLEWEPVTKPYYNNWRNGITVELPDGTTTDVASGLTDEDRAWLATAEAATAIAKGDLYAVVKAMSFNDKGRLRHPYLVKLRMAEDGAKEE